MMLQTPLTAVLLAAAAAAAGKQAEVLNQVIGELLDGHPVSDVKLKEVLGHTPLQVRGGGGGGGLAGPCVGDCAVVCNHPSSCIVLSHGSTSLPVLLVQTTLLGSARVGIEGRGAFGDGRKLVAALIDSEDGVAAHHSRLSAFVQWRLQCMICIRTN
jgi:hypothetical protein